MFILQNETGRYPLKIWLENEKELEASCREQAYHLTELPFLRGWVCLMPDTHAGMGMPIGGVIAAKDVIIPNAVGVDIGTSALVSLNLKELGVRRVICKAQSHVHRKVLEKIGADRVVFPEHEMGVKLAQGLSSSNVLNFIELSEDFGIVETTVPRDWLGKNLIELNVRARYKVNIIAVRKKGQEEFNVTPGPSTIMEAGDAVVALGRTEDVNRLQDL